MTPRIPALILGAVVLLAATAAPEPVANALSRSSEPFDGGIGSVLIGGTATWYCSETSPCTRGYGPSDMVAAIDPTLGIPKGGSVTVCHEGTCIDVRIVDVCACQGSRLIDLTSGAFSRLADLERGVIEVTVEAGVPSVTLPPTDATDTEGVQ